MRSASSSGRSSCIGTSCSSREEGRARARFFAAGAVLAEQTLPGGERRPGGLDAAAGVRAPVPQRGLWTPDGADLPLKLVRTRSHS